jgi:hypothetical protein
MGRHQTGRSGGTRHHAMQRFHHTGLDITQRQHVIERYFAAPPDSTRLDAALRQHVIRSDNAVRLNRNNTQPNGETRLYSTALSGCTAQTLRWTLLSGRMRHSATKAATCDKTERHGTAEPNTTRLD